MSITVLRTIVRLCRLLWREFRPNSGDTEKRAVFGWIPPSAEDPQPSEYDWDGDARGYRYKGAYHDFFDAREQGRPEDALRLAWQTVSGNPPKMLPEEEINFLSNSLTVLLQTNSAIELYNCVDRILWSEAVKVRLLPKLRLLPLRIKFMDRAYEVIEAHSGITLRDLRDDFLRKHPDTGQAEETSAEMYRRWGVTLHAIKSLVAAAREFHILKTEGLGLDQKLALLRSPPFQVAAPKPPSSGCEFLPETQTQAGNRDQVHLRTPNPTPVLSDAPEVDKFCNYCGRELPRYANFCRACGKQTGSRPDHPKLSSSGLTTLDL